MGIGSPPCEQAVLGLSRHVAGHNFAVEFAQSCEMRTVVASPSAQCRRGCALYFESRRTLGVTF